MKRTVLAVIVVLAALVTAGCGDSGNAPPLFVTQILSDPAIDGTITQTSTGVIMVSQSMTPTIQSVTAGIDPATLVESRAFLDFPLSGVPLDAVIQQATLDIIVSSIQSVTGQVPIEVDLVSFPSTILDATDFGQAPLAWTTYTVSANNPNPRIDVTPLVAEAQLLLLNDVQIRIRGGASGLITINDSTGADRGALAPILEVAYF